MAYMITHFWPGGTEEQYRATIAAIHAASGPQPELFHAAGPTDGGFLIVGTYESKEVMDSFINGTLMPLMPVEGGFAGRPEERAAEIVS